MHTFCLPRAAPQCQDHPASLSSSIYLHLIPFSTSCCVSYLSLLWQHSRPRRDWVTQSWHWGGAQKPRDPALQCFSLELFSLSVFRQKIEYTSQNIFVRTGSRNRIHNPQYPFHPHFPLFQCAPQVIHRKAEEKLGDSKVMLLSGLTVCQPWYWTLERDH